MSTVFVCMNVYTCFLWNIFMKIDSVMLNVIVFFSASVSLSVVLAVAGLHHNDLFLFSWIFKNGIRVIGFFWCNLTHCYHWGIHSGSRINRRKNDIEHHRTRSHQITSDHTLRTGNSSNALLQHDHAWAALKSHDQGSWPLRFAGSSEMLSTGDSARSACLGFVKPLYPYTHIHLFSTTYIYFAVIDVLWFCNGLLRLL